MLSWKIAGINIRAQAIGRGLPTQWASVFENFRLGADESIGEPDILLRFLFPSTWTVSEHLSKIFPGCIASGGEDEVKFDRLDFSGAIRGEGGKLKGEFSVKDGGDSVLQAVLTVSISHYLAARGVLLLHASGVRRNGKLWLFSGPSGSGKTTIATELNMGGEPFSVDRTAVSIDEGGRVIAHPTPLSDSENRCPASLPAPIAGIAFIEQSRSCGVRIISVAEAAWNLLKNVLTMSRDKNRDMLLLQSAEAVAEKKICSLLEFSRDESFWPLLDEIDGRSRAAKEQHE